MSPQRTGEGSSEVRRGGERGCAARRSTDARVLASRRPGCEPCASLLTGAAARSPVRAQGVPHAQAQCRRRKCCRRECECPPDRADDAARRVWAVSACAAAAPPPPGRCMSRTWVSSLSAGVPAGRSGAFGGGGVGSGRGDGPAPVARAALQLGPLEYARATQTGLRLDGGSCGAAGRPEPLPTEPGDGDTRVCLCACRALTATKAKVKGAATGHRSAPRPICSVSALGIVGHPEAVTRRRLRVGVFSSDRARHLCRPGLCRLLKKKSDALTMKIRQILKQVSAVRACGGALVCAS